MASIEVLNTTQANVEAPVEIQLSLGNPIYRGPAGRDGTIGHDGKSAYEVAVDNGFTGTETEWLASLQGSSANTPVKGVDYFTEQDIQDFIAQIPDPDLSAYATKAEVETAIRGAETGLLKRSVVQSLPISNIDDNTIYMVPKIGSTGDVYDEYLYVSNVWEHIGSTDVDLTDYKKVVSLSLGNPVSNNDEAVFLHELTEYYKSLLDDGLITQQTKNYFKNTDIYIDNIPIEHIVINKDNYGYYLWFFGIVAEGNGFFRRKFRYNNRTNALTSQTSETVWIDNAVLYSVDNRVDNSTQTLGQNFRYIKTNYVKTSEMPEYLTNSDILAIWNGTNE